MSKFTRRDQSRLSEFMRLAGADGCLSVDKWTSGRGIHTTNRALPPFVRKFERGNTDESEAGLAARSWLERNPKRKHVLALEKGELMNFLFTCAIGHDTSAEASTDESATE